MQLAVSTNRDDEVVKMDAGFRALRLLRDGLMIDDQWLVETDRGFSWKAQNLVQHIDASPVFTSRGVDVSLVTVHTPIVTQVDEPSDSANRFLLAFNTFSVGTSILVNSETHTLMSALAHQVNDDTIEVRVRQLFLMALLQLSHAESVANIWAKMFNGKIAGDGGAFQHRSEPNEILTLAGELVAADQDAPSRFADQDELESVLQLVKEGDLGASLGWWEGGITVEVPFGPYDTTLIELRNDITHPSLGAGLAVRTTLRTEFLDLNPAKLAVDLQRLQLQTVDGGGQLGAWGIRDDLSFGHVAWSRFIPNVLFSPGLSADVAMGEINRALWCDRLLFPALPPRNAWELMTARDKLRANAGAGGFIA